MRRLVLALVRPWGSYRARAAIMQLRGLGVIPVAAHEFGHLLGFGHVWQGCSIMAPAEGDRSRSVAGPRRCRGCRRQRRRPLLRRVPDGA